MTTSERVSDEAVLAAKLARRAEILRSPFATDDELQRAALSAALPLLEGGKGEPVAWMVRNTDTGKVYWNEEACVFTDGASADSQADCLNDGDEAAWEAFPLYTVPQPAAQQPAGDGVADALMPETYLLPMPMCFTGAPITYRWDDGEVSTLKVYTSDQMTSYAVRALEAAISALRANAGGVRD